MDSDSESELLAENSEEEYSSSESESDDETLEDVRDWCKISASYPSPPKFPFLGFPGIKIPLNDSSDPLEYFYAFFQDEIFSFIVHETNKYAGTYFESANLTPSSRALKWRETDHQEMKCFLALLLLQGVVQKPVEKWFWSKRPILHTPFFGKIMSSERYGLIMKFLHFENTEEFDSQLYPNNKLKKISIFHHMLVEKFKSVFVPNQNISIDESLIAYKGRLGWKQYIPSKRARFGIKLFQLCESESGYIWNSFIYTGKGTVFDKEYEQYGIATKTVLTLMDHLKGKGYTLTTDNFYTSPELAELLIKCRTDVCGTMKLNRKGLPLFLKNEKLKKGDVIACQKGKICAMEWKDKKPLLILSTFHNSDMEEVPSYRKNEVRMKPKAVTFYNKNMGGVDRSDQCLSYYPVARNRQRKYYKKIFRHLLSQTVWNAFVLYKKNSGDLSHVSFRMKLIERLIEDAGVISVAHTSHNFTTKASENVMRLTGRHFPSYVEPNSIKKTPSRKCYVCCLKQNENGKRVRRESRFQCKECDVGLCAAPCFEIYHTVNVL